MDAEDLVHYEGYGSRPRSLRRHWINCCLQPDLEVIDIDRMEDELTAKERGRALPIRRLIARFETCHWNSDRWLERIVQAIAEERVPPTSGRPRTEHPLAQMLGCLRQLLTHWVARSTGLPQCAILDRSSTEIVRSLGTWTPYKAWVVQRIIEGLEHHMCSAGLLELPATSRAPSLPGDIALDSPEADPYFADSLDLLARARSQRLKVKREIGGQVQEHSLAQLIGSLTPCNETYFLFLFALFDVLDAPDEDRILPAPFCGSISHSRQQRYCQVINALRQYLGKPPEGSLAEDEAVLARLGEPTSVKRWLAASLEKTLREQVPPPPAVVNE
jgi:hypothetical protein